jgi:hypothetical protein
MKDKCLRRATSERSTAAGSTLDTALQLHQHRDMRPLPPVRSRSFGVRGLQTLTRMSFLVIVSGLVADACSRDLADAGAGGTGGTSVGGAGGGAGAGGGGGDSGNVGGSAGAYQLRAPAQHRVASDVCSVDRGAGGAGDPVYCGAGGTTGQLCTGLNPACCVPPTQPGFLPVPYCTADQCATDSDCPGTSICSCGGGGTSCTRNYCQSAGCRVDADCGAGMYCSPSLILCTFSVYTCHTPNDTCADNADCPPGSGTCNYDENAGRWRCYDLAPGADCPSL